MAVAIVTEISAGTGVVGAEALHAIANRVAARVGSSGVRITAVRCVAVGIAIIVGRSEGPADNQTRAKATVEPVSAISRISDVRRRASRRAPSTGNSTVFQFHRRRDRSRGCRHCFHGVTVATSAGQFPTMSS